VRRSLGRAGTREPQRHYRSCPKRQTGHERNQSEGAEEAAPGGGAPLSGSDRKQPRGAQERRDHKNHDVCPLNKGPGLLASAPQSRPEDGQPERSKGQDQGERPTEEEGSRQEQKPHDDVNARQGSTLRAAHLSLPSPAGDSTVLEEISVPTTR
jgi:hypothetical protein